MRIFRLAVNHQMDRQLLRRVRTLMHRLHSLQTTRGTFQSNLRSLVATNAFSFFSDNTPATVRRRRSYAVAFCSLFAILPQGGKSYCRHKMQKMSFVIYKTHNRLLSGSQPSLLSPPREAVLCSCSNISTRSGRALAVRTSMTGACM